MTSPRIRSGAFVLAALLAALPRTASADGKSEYYTRLVALAPRSADAHVQLGEWCRQAGLESEALECFKKAVAIDTDCAQARQVLGYRRYGTGWRKEGEKTAGFERPGGSSRRPSVALPASAAASPAPGLDTASGGVASSRPGAASSVLPEAPASAETDKPASSAIEPGKSPPVPPEETEVTAKKVPAQAPGSPPETPPAATPPGARPGAQTEELAAEIEKKKAWAKAASEKIQAAFFTYEDNDFLVHSTLPASSREMKLLLFNLKGLKKTIAIVIGVSGSARIWPDKLQLVLLKSEPEYERFANMVDAIQSAKNPEGAYTSGSHSVLVSPDSDALARILGETALRRLNGSEKWVAWWLEQGVAELVFAQSPAGQKKEHYANTIKYAADVIKAEGEILKIFNLLETPSYKDKDSTRNRALALSLVHFLFKKSQGGFHDLIKTLKSDAAPAPPPADSKSKEEFNAFHLSYISFQEKAIESSFRMSLSAIQERWKAFTLQAAEAIKAQETAEEKKKQQQQQQQDQNKPRKGKGKQGGA